MTTANTHDGEHYLKLRQRAGLSRRQVQEATGITQGKLGRIETRGIFKDDERQRLDAFYASTGDDASARDDVLQHASQDAAPGADEVVASLVTPELARDMYLQLYARIPAEAQAEAHAAATAGFPAAQTFDESWLAATDQQRQDALRVLEQALPPNPGEPEYPPEPTPPAEPVPDPKKPESGQPPRGQQTLTRAQRADANTPTHPDPSGIGFLVDDDGRAWRHDGDKWQREPASDVPALGDLTVSVAGRYEYKSWAGLTSGDRVGIEGEKGVFKFDAYVIPPRGPAYVSLFSNAGKSTRTVAPERITRPGGEPVDDTRYGLGWDDQSRIHAVPRTHYLAMTKQAIKTPRMRCGVDGHVDWSQTWTSRRLDVNVCPRCVELTGGR